MMLFINLYSMRVIKVIMCCPRGPTNFKIWPKVVKWLLTPNVDQCFQMNKALCPPIPLSSKDCKLDVKRFTCNCYKTNL